MRRRYPTITIICPECDGVGTIAEEGAAFECDECEGTGKIPDMFATPEDAEWEWYDRNGRGMDL